MTNSPYHYVNKKGELRIVSYWYDGDEDEVDAQPWETFKIGLWGEEAGDAIFNYPLIKKILRNANLSLINRKTGEILI